MKIGFPSSDFEDAVAAVCHGVASDGQVQALNELLRENEVARDEYILRLELHSRLASDPDLFVSTAMNEQATLEEESRQRSRGFQSPPGRRKRRQFLIWTLALAASVAVATIMAWWPSALSATHGTDATSQAVAMLSETANARWATATDTRRLGAPLEPGLFKLEGGLAQIVFYSGARVVIEGPAELKLVSANQAFCIRGKMTAEVPAQARGFRIDTPHGNVTDLGTAFGLEVNDQRTEVHVFKGEVVVQRAGEHRDDHLREGSGVVMDSSKAVHPITANEAAFASLFELQSKSAAAQVLRLRQWRIAGERLDHDASLAVRLDFDEIEPSRWQLSNVSEKRSATGDATIVGCQWGQGRWGTKRALEFQGVSDRVRLNVPGECEALTLAAWVRVQGLDRKLNSLFMCDGFAAGSVHWLIRNDGVLGVTIVGQEGGNYEIATSPPVLTVDRFGTWVHLAVVVDGRAGRVIHYVNGQPVADVPLHIKPPYRIGTAELGNWNSKGFPKSDPFTIRNFSGAMDEFCAFVRPLNAMEIQALYAEGKPDAEILASR